MPRSCISRTCRSITSCLCSACRPGNFVEIEILGVDRLLVYNLCQLGPDVLRPVRDLCALPMVAQRFDVDHPGKKGRAVGKELLADDGAAIVHDHRLSADRIDRCLAGRVEVVTADIRRDDVHVVFEGACPVRDFEEIVLGEGRGEGSAIDYLGAVQGETAAVLG